MILYAVCGGVSDTDSMFTVQRVIAKRKCYSGVFTNRLSATFVKLAVRCSSIVMLSPPPLEKSEECHLMRNGRCVMYSHRRMKRERENMWCIWKDTFLIFVIVMKPGDNFTRAEGDHAIFVFSFHFSTRCAKFPLPLPDVTTGWIERRCSIV